MKRIFITIFLCATAFLAFSQEQKNDSITEVLAKYYSNHEYNKIIEGFTTKAPELSAKALYFLGNAYYMLSKDELALKYLNKSLEKDNTDSDTFYIKGMVLSYMRKPEKAITNFEKAITINSENFYYHVGLGNILYVTGEFKRSLEVFNKVLELDDKNQRALFVIPVLYQQLGDEKASLEAFYKAKELLSYESESYQNILYNIGVKEYINKNFDKAEEILKELVTVFPQDYEGCAKLIQVYYGKKEQDKAKVYKEKLYEAYKSSSLKERMKDMFCFDQFSWEDKLILAYERFGGDDNKLHYKHIFFVTDPKENQQTFTIQTENSPVSFELTGKKYVLGMDKENVHYTFPVDYGSDIEYDKLKHHVVLILEEKIEPTASSYSGKK